MDNNAINWISDDTWFPDNTSCHDITGEAVNYRGYDKVRIFNIDSGKRCYNLTTTKDQEYLIRGTFLFGDSVKSLGSSFDVLIGLTSITQVNSSEDLKVEGIFRATNQHIDFCLMQDRGNPYISQLELRPLDDLDYLRENSTTVLKLVSRIDAGNTGDGIRYVFYSSFITKK